MRKLSIAALIVSGAIGTGLLTGAAFAQTPSTANAPTTPTANDPSYGTSMSPSSMSGSPVAMDPHAARKEGTTPPNKSNETGAPAAK